jgi:hypothetical protein
MKAPTRIAKTSDVHNTVTYVVLEPDVEDYNGDTISPNEIIKTAHEFITNLAKKTINVDHVPGSELDNEDAYVVESYVLPTDLPVGDDIIKIGSRMVGIKFSQDIYKKVLDGEIVGVSMEGVGRSDE